MATEKKHAAWMHKDGKRSLFHGDDVEAAALHGWAKITEGARANGQPWNPDLGDEDAIAALDAAAESLKTSNKVRDDRSAKKAEDAEKARKKAEQEAASRPEKPDMKVQIVDPPKSAGKK